MTRPGYNAGVSYGENKRGLSFTGSKWELGYMERPVGAVLQCVRSDSEINAGARFPL